MPKYIFICWNKRPVQFQLKNTFITYRERWDGFKKSFGLCEEKKEIKYTEHYLNNIKAMIQENKRQEIQSGGVMCYPPFQLLCPFTATAEKKIETRCRHSFKIYLLKRKHGKDRSLSGKIIWLQSLAFLQVDGVIQVVLALKCQLKPL